MLLFVDSHGSLNRWTAERMSAISDVRLKCDVRFPPPLLAARTFQTHIRRPRDTASVGSANDAEKSVAVADVGMSRNTGIAFAI